MAEQVLELRGITKRFNGVTVLDRIDFDLRAGEVHGLLGENGAGKSTLMKILNGALAPNEGQIIIDGKQVHYASPDAARHCGVGMVYQELNLFTHLSVAENIFVSHMPKNRAGLVVWGELRRRAAELLIQLGISLDVAQRLDTLSIAQQQIVAIVRALVSDCRILILDEPTSALPQRDVDNLFEVMRKLRERGIAVVFISHKLGEVLAVTDRVTVLNNGRKIASLKTADTDEESLSRLIVGRQIENKYPKVVYETKEELIRLENVSLMGRLEDISFRLHRGEVLGIVGLLGAGKTEIAKTIFGVYGNRAPLVNGSVYLLGQKLDNRSPLHAVKSHVGLISENRGEEGLLLEHSIRTNISMSALRLLSRFGFVKSGLERATAAGLVERLGIKCRSLGQKVKNLSGGNQQKVVISKWLASKAKLVIFDEPTRGIDVGAKVEVYKLMNELLEQGYGVLLLSSEVPEVHGMADRILVLREGRIVRELTRGEVSEQELQRLVM